MLTHGLANELKDTGLSTAFSVLIKLFSRYLMFHHLIVYVFFSIKHNVTSIKYQSSIMPYGQVTELQYKLNSVFCDTKQSSLSCRTGSGTLNFDIETTFFITYF